MSRLNLSRAAGQKILFFYKGRSDEKNKRDKEMG